MGERITCMFHKGKICTALKEMYCKTESTPCNFYKPKDTFADEILDRLMKEKKRRKGA